MDSATTPDAVEAGDDFDTARITGEIDALADKHAGHEDVFRSAVAQLLKAELARRATQRRRRCCATVHGRRCAERLCFVQDEIIRLSVLGRDPPSLSFPIPRRRAHGRGRRPAVTAAA